jgi:hypothetical protein
MTLNKKKLSETKTDLNPYNSYNNNHELLLLLRKEVKSLISRKSDNDYKESIESFIDNIQDIFLEDYKQELIKELDIQQRYGFTYIAEGGEEIENIDSYLLEGFSVIAILSKYYQDNKLSNAIEVCDVTNEDVFCDSVLVHLDSKIKFLLDELSIKEKLNHNIFVSEIQEAVFRKEKRTNEEINNAKAKTSKLKEQLRKNRFELSLSHFISNYLLMLYRIKSIIEEKISSKKSQQLDEFMRQYNEKRSEGGKRRAEEYVPLKTYVIKQYEKQNWNSKRHAALSIFNNIKTSPNNSFKTKVTMETIYRWLLKNE